MWPELVVILAPGVNLEPGVGDADEIVLIQAFIPEAPVEALNMGLVRRLARPSEVESDSTLEGPGIQGLADAFGSIVDP